MFHSLQVEERMLVGVSPENFSEEGTAGSNDDFVSLQLGVLTSEGHIKEIFLLPEVPEGGAHVGLEVVPAEAEFL